MRDVVQIVLRTETEEGLEYFLAKRSEDEYWEFIGGKKESEESLKETATRELKEEIQINWEDDMFRIESFGDSYLSSKDEKYRLNPILAEIRPEVKNKINKNHLSNEHTDFEWIKIHDFFEYDSLGQFQGLENLGLVEGRVALAVARNNDGEFLFLERSEENSSSGKWVFPGGRIEEHEKVGDAAKRELKEETGLVPLDTIEVGDSYINEGELGFWKVTPVLFTVEDDEIVLNSEGSDFEWVKKQDINQFDTLGSFQAFDNLTNIKK